MPGTISILILTHNRADDLLALLQSLQLQEDKERVLQEILILNNASTERYDQVQEYIGAHPELKVNYIWSDTNYGVARGRNKLMLEARGDILFTIDDDMEFPQRDALKRISGLFDQPFFRENQTAVITLRVIYFSTKEVQETVFPHKQYERYRDRKQFLTLYFAGGGQYHETFDPGTDWLVSRELFLWYGRIRSVLPYPGRRIFDWL